MDHEDIGPYLDRFHPNLKYLMNEPAEVAQAQALLAQADHHVRPFDMDSFAVKVFNLLYKHAPFAGNVGVDLLVRPHGPSQDGWEGWEFKQCLTRIFNSSPQGLTRLPLVKGVVERLIKNKRIARTEDGDLIPGGAPPEVEVPKRARKRVEPHWLPGAREHFRRSHGRKTDREIAQACGVCSSTLSRCTLWRNWKAKYRRMKGIAPKSHS
jgi:hypothetical protein